MRINQVYQVMELIYSSFSEYKADLEKYTDSYSLVKDDGYVNDVMGYRIRIKAEDYYNGI
jgi:hypothetical protein